MSEGPSEEEVEQYYRKLLGQSARELRSEGHGKAADLARSFIRKSAERSRKDGQG